MKDPGGRAARSLSVLSCRERADRVRGGSARGRSKDEAGFGLIEVIVASLVLALAVAFSARSLTTSLAANDQAQVRMVAGQIAAQAIQEAEGLPYQEAAQGLDPSTVTTADPHFVKTGACWYYGPASNHLLVPTQGSSTPEPPFIPYRSGITEDKITFTLATYPMVQATSTTCTLETNDATPNVPIAVVVQVSWEVGGAQEHLTVHTMLYTVNSEASQTSGGTTPPPGPGPGPSSCPNLQEALLANPTAGELTPGATASIFFLDEDPTTVKPEVFVDGTEDPTVVPDTLPYGTSAGPSFLTPATVHPVGDCGGSPPNADDPPTTAKYPPSSTNLPAEDKLTFVVPTSARDGSLTIIVFDHDGNYDSYTWSVGT